MTTIPDPAEVEQAGSTSPGTVEFFRGLALELSDERDEHAARLLAAERRAYLDGYAAGYARAQQDAGRSWALTPPPPPVSPGPTLAELRRRRGQHGPLCACRACRRG